MFKIRRFVLLPVVLLITIKVTGQVASVVNKTDFPGLGELYIGETGSPREYINGKEYLPYYYHSREVPILRFEENRTASLTVHDRSYNGLVLNYDMYTDELIYTDDSLIYNNLGCFVSLNKYFVDGFDLYFRYDTLHFKYLSLEKDTSFNLPDGFYEVIFDSKARFLIKHTSSPVISVEKVENYKYRAVSYVNLNGGYVEAGTRRHFVALFGDKSEEISYFLRRQHIRIKKANKKQIVDLLTYYEELLKGGV